MADENPYKDVEDAEKWLQEQLAKGRTMEEILGKEAVESNKKIVEQTKQEAAERQIGQKLDMLNLLTALKIMGRNS